MLIAVLNISKILSIPIIIAIPSTGKPICTSTIDNISRPTPGTPAVPIEAKVAVTITVTKSINVKSIPNN